VILETLADFGGITKKTDILVELVRQALARQISLQYADENGVLRVMTVAQSFLEKLLESKYDGINGPEAMLDPVLHRKWISALSSSMAAIKNQGFWPIILCPESVRVLLKNSIERELPAVVVLSTAEISSDVKLEALGEVYVD